MGDVQNKTVATNDVGTCQSDILWDLDYDYDPGLAEVCDETLEAEAGTDKFVKADGSPGSLEMAGAVVAGTGIAALGFLKGSALAKESFAADAGEKSGTKSGGELFTDADISLRLDSAQSVFESGGKSFVSVEGVTTEGEVVKHEIPWKVYDAVRTNVMANWKVQLHEVDWAAMEILSAHPEIVDGKIDKGQPVVVDEFSFDFEETRPYLEQGEKERMKLVDQAIDELFPDRAARDAAEVEKRRAARELAEPAQPSAVAQAEAAPGKSTHPIFDPQKKGMSYEPPEAPIEIAFQKYIDDPKMKEAAKNVESKAAAEAGARGGSISVSGERAQKAGAKGVFEKVEGRSKVNAEFRGELRLKPRLTPVR